MRGYSVGKTNALDAVISYSVALLILLFVGGIFYDRFGFYGLGVTQLAIVVTPLVLIGLKKDSYKEVLRLRFPSVKHIIGSLILWNGLFLIVNGLTQLLMPLSDYNLEVAEELSKLTYHPNIIINLIVVALAPSLCEEILFRGLIFKGISNQYNEKIGLILSSILFGMLHFDWIRIVPTTILGLGIGYAVYKSGSILIGVVIHFINNGLVVFVSHLVPIEEAVEQSEVVLENMWQGSLFIIVVGLFITWIAMNFFRERNKM